MRFTTPPLSRAACTFDFVVAAGLWYIKIDDFAQTYAMIIALAFVRWTL